MSVHKFLGIETEFGIVQRGVPESNPIAASSMLINAYLDARSSPDEVSDEVKVEWDFVDESPGQDARGTAPAGALAPEVETHLVNTVLSNGARYYVDHAHPELSTPECADARAVVVWDKAAETVLIESMRAAQAVLPPGQELVIYKNNSDGKGNSYGCHENYLMDRSVPFHQIITHATAHLITRQIFTGSGKLGSEAPGVSSADVPFQITQRADFFEAEVGLETTLKRPIVNTRDEPHADPAKYRRLHVICGDANCSEVATLLKVGTTAFVLAMVEAEVPLREVRFAAPVRTMREVSRDVALSQAFPLVDGTKVTPIDVQWELLAAARRYVGTHGYELVGGSDVATLVLDEWELVLAGLEEDPMTLADRLDWVAKHRLLQAYRERHDIPWSDGRLAALALQYHDLRPERSLAARAGLRRVTTDAEVARAVDHPPEDTRAWFRGTCLRKYGPAVVAANWDSIVFDIGNEPLRRVPMMEPGRGTKALLGDVVDRSDTPAELLEALGA